jgi:ribosome-associated translation inhibitor RaiA
MYWANFFHIYQPASQQPDILEAVVAQSYRPILEAIKNQKNVSLSLNVNGALLELFDKHGYSDLIETLKGLLDEGRLEITGCAKYHAFLPLIEEDEIIRQIKLNDETNKFFLGPSYKPKGFFPPEMGFKEELIPIVSDLGFEWIILDEIALGGKTGQVDYKKIYKIKNSKLLVFFRERRASNLIMSALIRTAEALKHVMEKDFASGRYLVTAMDGETFGHHRPGLQNLLPELFAASEFQFIKISDIPKYFKDVVEVEPVKSTWASSLDDIQKNIQFLSWFDPENVIHQWQWQLFELVLDAVHSLDKKHPDYKQIRSSMDIAMASDHFWWASAKPWWSLEMIEDGAWRLLETIRMCPGIAKEKLQKASELYEKIISTAFEWQRSGQVRKNALLQRSVLRIPFKERTVSIGGAQEGVYWAFIDMMKKMEKKAAQSGEYENAILWRDAIYKLENKLDIYDAINAIDLLRAQMPNEEIEKTIEKYKKDYQNIRGGQPEQRGA